MNTARALANVAIKLRVWSDDHCAVNYCGCRARRHCLDIVLFLAEILREEDEWILFFYILSMDAVCGLDRVSSEVWGTSLMELGDSPFSAAAAVRENVLTSRSSPTLFEA